MRIPGQVPTPRGHADHAARARRDQLGAAVLQPAHRPVLRRRTGRTPAPSPSKASSRAPPASRTATPMGQANADAELTRRTKKATASSARSIRTTLDAEVGIQDERHHVGRRAHDGVATSLFSGGKEGYFFALDARTGELLWKVVARRAGQQRADELLGQRQAVRHGRGRQLAVRVRVAAVAAETVTRPGSE